MNNFKNAFIQYGLNHGHIKPKETEKTTHKITIVWGTDREEEKTYSFHNKTELECFVRGVEESNGWLEYDITAQK